MTIADPSSPYPSMELLAPAGTVPAFEAALHEGADAVYVGAPGLNARALARDFTMSEIAAMTEYAHGRGKKLYVAMNSLMKEDEVRLALETLLLLAKIGPDALIIQDMGILYLVRQYFPELKVHASTLMTVNNAMAADYLKGLGFERIVLARELSLDEIRTIHRHSAVPLEIFIHGAMCFSYSGLCRFSSLHGGKSSLRGQCVQPCRRRYDWLPSGKRTTGGHGAKGGGYLFSMNDLSGIDYLAAARDAGVVSLKIEGRLKSVEYVRNAVRAYRLALDALEAVPKEREGMLETAHRHLDAAMGRKRSSGFFQAGNEDQLIIPRLSGSTGEVIGKVMRLEETKKGRPERVVTLQVALQAGLQVGDRLRLYEERTGDRKSFTLRSLEVKGKVVDQASAGQTVTIRPSEIEPGSLRQPFQGILFRVDVSGRMEKQHSSLRRSAAHMQVPPPDPLILERLLTALAINREGLPGTGRRVASRRQSGQGKPGRERKKQPEWWLKVRSLGALAQRYPFKVARVLLDLNKENVEQHVLLARQRSRARQPVLVWALPSVLGEEQVPWYRDAVRQLRLQGAEHFQISHIGQLALFSGDTGRQRPETYLEIYGDDTCNALNSAALRMYAAEGLSGVQFFLEADRATLAASLAHFARRDHSQKMHAMKVGVYVYGRPPLFSARLDAPHFQGQRSFASPRGERYYLDRRGETLCAFSHTTFSLLQHVDELTSVGVDYLVVDVSHGQVRKEGAEITALLSGRGEGPPVFSGNFAGTLL